MDTNKLQSEMEFVANVTATLRDAKTGKIKKIVRAHNKIPTVGLAGIISQMTEAVPTPTSIRITYGEAGTGSTAPAAGDTATETPLNRVAVASISPSSTTAYITLFFGTTEANGALREATLWFGSATSTIGTGTLLSRVAISITKTSSDTLTLDWTITASSLT